MSVPAIPPVTHINQTRIPSSTTHSDAIDQPILSQLTQFGQELLAAPLPSASSTSRDENHEEDGGGTPLISLATLDHTPLALASAYRMWCLLLQSSSRLKLDSYLDHILTPQLIHQLARFMISGHELSFFFVRLMILFAYHPITGGILADGFTANKAKSDTDGVSELISPIDDIIGLLRLSKLPLLTCELIELVGILCGAHGSNHVEDSLASDIRQRQRQRHQQDRDMPGLVADEEKLYSRYLDRHVSREKFIKKFLQPSSRSILLLTKHIGDNNLSEWTRLLILQSVYQFATFRFNDISANMRIKSTLRKVLLDSESKWSIQILPKLSSSASSGGDTHSANAHLHRRRQERCIRDIKAVLVLMKVEDDDGESSQQHRQTAPPPSYPAQPPSTSSTTSSQYGASYQYSYSHTTSTTSSLLQSSPRPYGFVGPPAATAIANAVYQRR